MIEAMLMSIGLGLTGGFIAMYGWVYLRYAILKNRCKNVITKFLVRIGLDNKSKSLSKLCSKKLLEKVEPLSNNIRGLGRLNRLANTKLLSMTQLSETTDKATLVLEAHFQKGSLKAQVTVAANNDLAEIRDFNIV